MKCFLALTLSLVCLSLSAQKYQGDSWATVKASGKGTLTIVYYKQPGLIYSENGKMKGVCVEIISDFAEFVEQKYGKKLDVKYAGEETAFTDFLKTVQDTKDILGVTNVTITEERKKIFKFTPPFLSNPPILLTHKNAPNVTAYGDINLLLKGYTAEIIGGSTHVKRIEQLKKQYAPGLTVEYVENGPGILRDIAANPKVFTILDFTEYVDAVRKNLPVKRQNLDLGNMEDLAYIMAKRSDWDEPWNAFLTSSYRMSSRYRKIVVDNLGATFLAVIK
ncbi:MAG TPA: transporter substrate-binding domain-containing protein [Cyclobacteriaceae bacterium]